MSRLQALACSHRLISELRIETNHPVKRLDHSSCRASTTWTCFLFSFPLPCICSQFSYNKSRYSLQFHHFPAAAFATAQFLDYWMINYEFMGLPASR
jgi:hypothetical protein